MGGMFLMIDKTLGHYQIIEKIGEGGMGEVYQAKDLKLGRNVAIKVLPEEFAKDTDRVARFQREATLLASLNHPNIAAIHGLEESGGTQFIVLELVEGQTLRDRIKPGPIPVEEALKLALQIAEALEAAHEKGVIHRDLKPSNIKVTPNGKVKVLDFGLAKAFAGERADLDLSNSPTLSNLSTQQGVILGTAAYMSPEQARGKPVDKRADIWAFGVVLYEMLTGRSLFSGDDVSQTLARVLERQPDFSTLPPNLHPRIRLLLERCLEKDPKNRYSGIADARVDIQKVLADPSGVLVQPVTVVEPRSRLKTILPWIAAVVILSAITGAIVWKLKPSEPYQVMRFTYELPKDQQINITGNITAECALAVSPDGRQFVYSTDSGLYLRSMGDMDARLLPGTGGTGQRPFFSPDGKWIGFVSSADNKLKKIATSGGAAVTLMDVPTVPGLFDWNADDTIVYGQFQKGIVRIYANGGTPEQIVKPAEHDPFLFYPQILPDGKSVLFTVGGTGEQGKITVQSLKSGERKELMGGIGAKYLPTGHLIYALGNNLLAVQFDLDTLEVVGGPVPMVEGIMWTGGTGAPQYAVSDSGTLVYIPGTTGESGLVQNTLVWVDRNGKEEPLAAAPNAYYGPRISPDGTKVALEIDLSTGGNSDIWIWDLVRETMTRLTFYEGFDKFPLWTPDGERIAFESYREENRGIFWIAADGTGKIEHLGSAPDRVMHPESWSSDGKTLVLAELSTSLDIGTLSIEGDRKWKPLLQEKHQETAPRISPDGQWITYISDESGQFEVYVRPFPDVGSGGKWKVSTSGGNSPLWSPTGHELFYRIGDAVMVVSVETNRTFMLGTPKVLFRGTYMSATNPQMWDISPDGKRFLMMKEVASTGESAAETPQKINIVLNWFEELKERVPVN